MKLHGKRRIQAALALVSAIGWLGIHDSARVWSAEPPIPGSPPAAPVETTRDGRSGQDSEEVSNPVPPTQAAKPAEARQRLGEVVSVGSSARVGPRQSASEVVVVHGDANIEGDVRGDVVVVFGKLKIEGRVRGDVVVVLGEAEVTGGIGGDTALILSHGRFGPTADLDGELLAVGVPPEVDPAASLKSTPEIVSLGPLLGYFEGAKDYLLQGVLLLRPFPPRVGWVWVAAGMFLVLHVMVALILSRPLGQCMEMVRDQPARSFLVGLLACVLVGPISLLLSFTLIAPFLIWIAFFALCVFGRVATYGAAGAALTRAAGMTGLSHPVGAVLVGSVVLYLCYMIPVVGMMVYALALPLGVGAVLIRILDAIRNEQRPTPGVPRGPSMAAASALASGAPGPATHGFEPVGTTAPQASVETPPAGAPGTPGPLPGESTPPAGTPPPMTPPPFASASASAAAAPVPPRVIPMAPMDDLAMPRVGFWPRLGASLIDLVLVGVINLATFQSAEAFWTLWALYHGILWTWKGTTLGGSVLNLRLVRLDGRAMDWQTAVVRVLGAVVSLVPLGLGFFWASWDAEFQAWHDRIAGTTIVKPERKVSLV